MSKLVFHNYNDKLTDEQQLNRQKTSIKKTKDNSQKLQRISQFSPTQSPVHRPVFRGPYGITTASTIIWYICICILFVVAFLALVLSVLYFITDSSTEQVIKLYGITGSGGLAIITFVIIFLDCCNDGDRGDGEEEAIYRILEIKETKDNDLVTRRKRRVATEKEVKPKSFAIQYQRSPQARIESHPHPYQHSSHHLYYTQPHHIHHIHSHPPVSYYDQFVCRVCHESHTKNIRHNQTDVSVDTSDRFEPIPKDKKSIHKSTRDAQTEPNLWDAEHGTQTDRTEGTQTSAMELSNLPRNVTEIIHETTVLRAPLNLLPTLKKSMEEQDKEIAINRAVADTNSLAVADV